MFSIFNIKNMISEETRQEYYRLKSLVNASRKEIVNIETFIRENIDPKCRICTKCSAQVRFHHQRLLKWGEGNIEKETPNELLDNNDTNIPKEEKEVSVTKLNTTVKNEKRKNSKQ